jgi:hypothetical protein
MRMPVAFACYLEGCDSLREKKKLQRNFGKLTVL